MPCAQEGCELTFLPFPKLQEITGPSQFAGNPNIGTPIRATVFSEWTHGLRYMGGNPLSAMIELVEGTHRLRGVHIYTKRGGSDLFALSGPELYHIVSRENRKEGRTLFWLHNFSQRRDEYSMTSLNTAYLKEIHTEVGTNLRQSISYNF
ncbi:MAG: hypothetical protein CL678_09210 [Bdellovibrionaceae bacterium]|nr:hypothetical protein [Pseudobdellovibrionaceae bacterium]